MNAEHNGRPATFARDHDPSDRLDHARMPPRALRLIDSMCSFSDHWLQPALRLCLDRFDKNLYQQAEGSRNHLEQQRCFDSRAVLQQGRAAFTQSFLTGLHESFSGMGLSDASETSLDMSQQSLALVERSEHELAAALDKLAARGEAHNGLLLCELGYRLAVLVGAPPLEGKALPPGPQNLARILRIASDPLNLPIEHRLLLLQSFEQSVNNALGSFYEGINATLLGDNILPRLQAFPAARTVHGTVHPSPTAAAATDAPAPVAAPPITASPAATSAAPAEHSEPIAVLETLRDLLSHQRMGVPGAISSAGRTATPDELQTALAALQQHVVQVTDQTSRELRSAQQLQEELLLQLNAGLPAGAPRTQLSSEQGDTVELVAMLFDQLAEQLHQGTDARGLLGNLQLPLLRMAVTDRDFFNQREHPARQLLNTLAEAINDWLKGPDGETDHQLLSKLSQLVERSQQEPPSAGLYTSLLADIEHHMAQLSRQAQATERRHIEAMQGREKLELARRRADELISARFAISAPRGLLRTLLERAWSDVIALNVLRHGEESAEFTQCLRVTDQLLGQFPVCDTALLRQEVESGLQQIGMNADEAGQVALRLIGTNAEPVAVAPLDVKAATAASPITPVAMPLAAKPPVSSTVKPAAPAQPAKPRVAPVAKAPMPRPASPPPIDPPSATDLAVNLKKRQRLGEHRGEDSNASAKPEVAPPPLGLREARIHNHLRELPYGTWFEFIDPANGERTQRKLAWFSPVSGNSLFVNRRGQRSDVMNLQDLARAIASGSVREVPPQEEKLLDRTWRVLAGNLRRKATHTVGALS